MDFIYGKERIYQKNAMGQIIAEITFPELLEGIYCIDHTFVDDSLKGQGVAGELVQQAVNVIEEKQGRVIATCPYAKKWLDGHGYVQDCLA